MNKAIGGSNGMKGEECIANHFGQHAVVIGGSLAGLMTARVLADHFLTLLPSSNKTALKTSQQFINRFRRAAMSMGCFSVDSR
jgi:hypothetical protein